MPREECHRAPSCSLGMESIDAATSDGQPITMQNGRLQVPDRPIIPFIEGDGTGPDIWRASQRVFDAAVAKAYGGKRQIVWQEVLAGQKSFDKIGQLAAGRNARRVPRIARRHQGPAHDAGRRRHPLAERGAAAIARFVRLPAAGALLPGRAHAGEAAGAGRHGDLPREHGRHLRRHRVRRRHGREPEGARLPRARVSEGGRQGSLRHQGESRRLAEAARIDRRAAARLAGRSRHRLQADQLSRHRAARAQRDRLRDPEQAEERDAGAQRQHHEVHRRRLPRLGLPGGHASSTAPRRSTAARGARFPTASRARASSSKT